MTRTTARTRTPLVVVTAGVALLGLAAPAVALEDTGVDGVADQAPADFVPEGPTVESVDDPSPSVAALSGDEATRVLAAAEGPIVLTGRGNGHGIGMSQYGARGQALRGRSHGQILGHYYQGSSLATRTVSFDPRIGVALDQSAVRVVARGANATLRFGGRTRTGVVGQAWEVRVLNSTATCLVIAPDGTEYKHAASRGVCLEADPPGGASPRIDLQVRKSGSWARYRQYGRDSVVEVVPDKPGSVWKVDAVVELPLEQYLYGLAEVPYSWETAALRSQAIAGRSYALWRLKDVGATPDRGCSCHLYDSQQDQVYAGWEREQSASWSRWKDAVDDTARTVVTTASGTIGTQGGVVQAFYSSSSNGRTEAKHELWGGSRYPYLVSVADGWSLDPATGNPHRSWEKEVARSTMAARVGLDQLSAVEVVERTSSGSSKQVRFSGVDGGSAKSVTASGSWVRSSFGLRSTTFEPTEGNLFTDVAGSPHAADILWIASQDITRGCNPPSNSRFCPKKSVTRGEMAAFITRAYGLPAGTKVFADTRGHTFQGDIAALYRAGITSGCSTARNLFCPNAPVSRAEMAAFMARAEKLPSYGSTVFTDAQGHLHESAIEAIRRRDITRGCNPPGNSRYCPELDVTREQMASFLRRALEG